MEEKLNPVKFGLSVGIVTALFVFVFEVFLRIKMVPYYNNLMTGVYGVAGLTTFTMLKILFISLALAFVIGFVFAWLLAWIYNKLLAVKIK